MKRFVLILIILFCTSFIITSIATAQTQYPPYPAGMRLLVGAQGVLARNTPSLNGTCGKDMHMCTTADAVPAGVYGVVQLDPPVFEAAGWWWVNVVYENGVTGWSSGYPPFLNQLNPPQMSTGFNFRVLADYSGPSLTQGICVSDGVQSAATLNLQNIPGGTGQQGTMYCNWTMPTVGNHIQVIQARNDAGTTASNEFQFAVTAKVVPQPPSAPTNLRIGPTTATTLLRSEPSQGPTSKPTKE